MPSYFICRLAPRPLSAKCSNSFWNLAKDSFAAREKRFTFDEEHLYVVLVFYNRLLQCNVLIDLKTDKLSHHDLGQSRYLSTIMNAT